MDAHLRGQLQKWTAALSNDPLEPADSRYVPLHAAGMSAVDDIRATIELSFTETTTQLLSGPAGSGKTTELRRLGVSLQELDYQVVIVDVLQYVSESAPVDVVEFLMAVALGAGDQLGAEAMRQGEDPKPGFGQRLLDLVKRSSVTFKAGPLAVSASADGVAVAVPGAEVEWALKEEMRSSPGFVEELRAKLAFHLGALHAEVSGFLQDLVAWNMRTTGRSSGVVLVVDSLEKLRGTAANAIEVQESVERLFVQHAQRLQFESHHTVYTVPVYLQFTAPGALSFDGTVRAVPVPHVCSQEGEIDEHCRETRAELREVVDRRVPWADLLPDEKALDRVIESSGGHLRVLFSLLRTAVGLVLRRDLSLPIGHDDVEAAIAQVAHGFSSPTREQGDFLRRIVASKGLIEPTRDEVPLLALLLQTQMVLGHANGRDWFEVHPLALRTLNVR